MTNTPLIIAPAVGILAFSRLFHETVNAEGVALSGWDLLGTSMVAGLVVLLMSNWRRQIMDSIPEPIRLGINGAVGALLAKTALEFFSDPASETSVLASGITAVVLVGLYVVRGRISRGGEAPAAVRVVAEGFYIVAFLVGFAAFLGIDFARGGEGFVYFRADNLFVADEVLLNLVREREAVELMLLLSYLLVILFVLLTDIPGTPFHLIDEAQAKANKFDRETSVRMSFYADGIVSVANPLLGLTPPIYYSENFVVRDLEKAGRISWAEVWTGRPAVVVGSLCLLAAAVLVALIELEVITQLPILHPELVAPILLFLALVVIADGMVSRVEQTGGSAPTPRTFHYYLPTAAALIATPRLGFAIGLSSACIVFFLIKLTKETAFDVRIRGFFALITGLAFLAAFIELILT